MVEVGVRQKDMPHGQLPGDVGQQAHRPAIDHERLTDQRRKLEGLAGAAREQTEAGGEYLYSGNEKRIRTATFKRSKGAVSMETGKFDSE